MVVKTLNYILLLSILLTSGLYASDISTTIDRNKIRVNETFQLTLNMETAPVSQPDLTGLPSSIEVVRSSNFYQRSSINGQSEINAGWRITLRATKEGVFTIPSFNIDGKNTKPIQITVLPAVNSTNIAGQQDAISLTADVDVKDVYIQQQVLLTIKLQRAVQAQYASLTEPVLEGAIVERLGEDRQYETLINGVRYIVLERQYVLFPQKAGDHKISSISFSAEVSDGSRTYSTFGRLQSRTRSVSLSTEEIELHVKGRPAGILDWWLPAKNIEISDSIQPDKKQYTVGEPITWSYTIKANGLTATQLPEILPKTSDDFKFYPDSPSSENTIHPDGLTGIRTQKVAVIPTKPGMLTLPEVQLKWWNIKTQKVEQLILPPRQLNVVADSSAPKEQNQQTEPKKVDDNKLMDTKNKPVETNLNLPTTEPVQENKVDSLPWKMIAIISLTLWIITALILVIKNSKKYQLNVDEHSRNKTNPLKTSHQVKLSDVKNACLLNNASEARKKLVAWSNELIDDVRVNSLSDIYQKLKDEELTEQIKQLEKYLYSNQSTVTNSWNGKTLANSLKMIEVELNEFQQSSKGDNHNKLPPLHPTSKS